MINHFWWSCQTCNEDYVELVKKWKSVLNHIKNKHRWKGNKVFKKCAHGKLRPEDCKDVAWLTEDSPAYKALEQVVLDKTLIADLKFVADFSHTGQIEVFHALINKYCPKRQHFWDARDDRKTAAHCFRSQQLCWKRPGHYTIWRSSGKIAIFEGVENWVWKPIKVDKDRSYVQSMIGDVIEMRQTATSYALPTIPNLPHNIAPTERPSTSDLKQVRSRFSS